MKKEGRGSANGNTGGRRVDPEERLRHVLSIALLLCALLLLLAIVSYTPLDQANADLRAGDLTGLLINDPVVAARADTTHNWLGLVGAVVSHFLINGTVGYGVVLLPLLLGLWGVTLYRGTEFERSTRTTLFALSMLVLVASIFGTLQLISWMPAPAHEWSGSVGAFLATVLSGLTGTAGSLLLLFGTLSVTIIYAADIDLRVALVFAGKAWRSAMNGASTVVQSTRSRFVGEDDSAIGSTHPIEAPDKDVVREEPARMMRRMRGSDLPAVAEPRIARQPASEQPRSSRSPLPDLAMAAPALPDEDHTYDRSVQPVGDLPPEASAVTSTDRPARVDEPQAQNIELVRGDQSPECAPAVVTPRLTLNVQEGENPDDVEVGKRGALIDKVRDEEIRYTPPSIALLTPQSEHEEVDDDELKENGRILQEKLGTFNIQIENLTVTPGPVVTLYEFVPAAGIKIAQIESLADDIALAMKARGIRIIAPIPGKGTVGVEIPNHRPAMVRIRSVLNTVKFREANFRLPLALGKTTVGEVFCDDLTRMPHLLIAGATGSGKSVGINAILASLIYKMHPRDLKLVIIDPKKIELAQYRSLVRHFLAKCPDIDEDIITTPQNAVVALRSLELEMDRRYDILAKGRQRNIADYNQKVADGLYSSATDFDHRKLPYIVVILDELADLMITARGEVEEPIARLAQLARAVGIHMVLATQRPSVDVITGTIKANFPARIAYQVASKIDSRTILDMSGAEYLLGNGDMLYLPGGAPKPLRLQNAFISTEEVEAMCNHIGEQEGYSVPYMLPSLVERKRGGGGSIDNSRDDLFEEAAHLVVRHQQGSVSLVQRRLKVGYSRAARIIDELEMAGIVGPFDGSKARQVLVEDENDIDLYL